MAQIRYRANLSAKDFVFTAAQWGRSVIMKQYDQNFSRQIVSPADPDKDIGIPQIFYGHNIMPAAQGFQSIGLSKDISSVSVLSPFAYQMLPWEGSNSTSRGYFLIAWVTGVPGVSNTYNVYKIAYSESTYTYLTQVVVPINGVTSTNRFTVASINGITYLYAPAVGCWSYDGTTFTGVTLSGLLGTNISGICAAFGYMIAWGPGSVSWSSTINPTDFNPSLITGAGGGSVQNLKGTITTIVPHIFGFIVFSALNCVAAVYSGNSRYPFNFREIIGGGGVSGEEQVIDLDSESGNLYAFTTAGIQIISVTQAQVVFPEAANFLGGGRFEDFNDTTLQFTETDVNQGTIFKQLSVVCDRYLVLSYGIITATNPLIFTHALVYDIAMKRWGKVKFTHVQAFSFVSAGNTGSQDAARTSFAFLDPQSNIYLVDFSYTAATGGTIILGKYQHARDRLITLQQVDVEYIQNPAALAVYAIPTLDGKTFLTPRQLTAISIGTVAPQYPTRITGMNISVLIQGVFQLGSLMLTYTPNGRR